MVMGSGVFPVANRICGGCCKGCAGGRSATCLSSTILHARCDGSSPPSPERRPGLQIPSGQMEVHWPPPPPICSTTRATPFPPLLIVRTPNPHQECTRVEEKKSDATTKQKPAGKAKIGPEKASPARLLPLLSHPWLPPQCGCTLHEGVAPRIVPVLFGT